MAAEKAGTGRRIRATIDPSRPGGLDCGPAELVRPDEVVAGAGFDGVPVVQPTVATATATATAAAGLARTFARTRGTRMP